MWQEERYQRIRALLSTLQQVSTDRIVGELGSPGNRQARPARAGSVGRTAPCAWRRGAGAQRAAHRRTRAYPREVQARHRAPCRQPDRQRPDPVPGCRQYHQRAGRRAGQAERADHHHQFLRRGRKIGAAGNGANEVLMLGGTVGGPVCATAGGVTVAEIHRYRADLALLSPVGVDAECGATSYDLREADVARAMADNARQRCCWPTSARSAYAAACRTAPRTASTTSSPTRRRKPCPPMRRWNPWWARCRLPDCAVRSDRAHGVRALQ